MRDTLNAKTLDRRFAEGGENVADLRVKLHETLCALQKGLPPTHMLLFHYTSHDVARLIGLGGFRLSDIGMGGGDAVYFTTASPSEPLGGARWPDNQFFSNLLYANYGESWNTPGRLQLCAAVLVCAIPSRLAEPVPLRPEARLVHASTLATNTLGLYLQEEICHAFQVAPVRASERIGGPVITFGAEDLPPPTPGIPSEVGGESVGAEVSAVECSSVQSPEQQIQALSATDATALKTAAVAAAAKACPPRRTSHKGPQPRVRTTGSGKKPLPSTVSTRSPGSPLATRPKPRSLGREGPQQRPGVRPLDPPKQEARPQSPDSVVCVRASR